MRLQANCKIYVKDHWHESCKTPKNLSFIDNLKIRKCDACTYRKKFVNVILKNIV